MPAPGSSLVSRGRVPPGLLAECLKADKAQLRQVPQGRFKAAFDAVTGTPGIQMEGDLVDVRADLAQLSEEPGDGLLLDPGRLEPDMEQV